MILKPNTCSTCSFKHREVKLDLKTGRKIEEAYCRRHAPVPHPVIVNTPQGPQLATVVSLFPTVQDGWWCGEYRNSRETVNGSEALERPFLPESVTKLS